MFFMNLSREVLARVTPEGITLMAICDPIIAEHPELNPNWIRNTAQSHLSNWTKTGRIERLQSAGSETLFALKP